MRPTAMPLGKVFMALILPTGSGKAATCVKPVEHGVHPRGGELKPVQQGRRELLVVPPCQVIRVGCCQLPALPVQGLPHGEQGLVAHGGRGGGHFPAMPPGQRDPARSRTV